jgi:putative transposase
MSRTARVVVAGIPHHVTQRGNNRQHIFLNDRDRTRYLRFLQEEGCRRGLRVLAYCLMSNHIHLVVIPPDEKALSVGIGRTHYAYTRAFNRAYDRSGHLWQNRFFSAAMDSSHTVAALEYVELNPRFAGMVDRAEDYFWSSARAHIYGRDRSGLLDMDWWSESGLAEDWAERLETGGDARAMRRIRQATFSGRPCGASEFVEQIGSPAQAHTAAASSGDSHG